jgi:MOSC domain-containing protein YiiM
MRMPAQRSSIFTASERHPGQCNLRQIHLVAGELYDRLNAEGLCLGPGDLGENIVIRGIDFTALSVAGKLHFAGGAAVAVTGLREPCVKIDRFIRGLKRAVTERKHGRALVCAAVMAVVRREGPISQAIRSMLKVAVAVPMTAVKTTMKDSKPYLVMDTTKDALKSAAGFKYDKNTWTWVPDTK